MPEVVIVYVHAALCAEEVLRLVGEETRGIVLAGVGEGNMPERVRQELALLAQDGIAVVRASRADEGLVVEGEGVDVRLRPLPRGGVPRLGPVSGGRPTRW